jgi:large subunit ribosomal protein L18Ae
LPACRAIYRYDYHQYEVIGRRVPSKNDPEPKAYRIKLFCKNETQARSRFWYFIRRLVKMKKASAEILSVREIFEKKPEKVSKYGIWVRYDSRSGTTNMHKEYTALSQNEAVQQMYQEMAGRHRARFSSIHIIKIEEIPASKCIRANTKQFLKANIAFPLPHRVVRSNKKGFNKAMKAKAPTTFMG